MNLIHLLKDVVNLRTVKIILFWRRKTFPHRSMRKSIVIITFYNGLI